MSSTIALPLVGELQSSIEGSRALDRRIQALALGVTERWSGGLWDLLAARGQREEPPAYSSVFEAAIRLAPSKGLWNLRKCSADRFEFTISIAEAGPPSSVQAGTMFQGIGRTAALAACAGLVLAMEHMRGDTVTTKTPEGAARMAKT